MKNRIVKLLLLAVVAIMLFGSVTASAYESYETYTYSIDGEPLPSPHAYTPDVQPYDTRTMNLLGGNFWHEDSTGDVVIWPKTETNAGIDYSTVGVEFTLNAGGDGYVVTGFDGSNKNVLIPAVHEKLPVVGIEMGAFNDVTVTDNNGTPVYTVSGGAAIENVRIDAALTEIPAYTFAECRSLVSVVIPAQTVTIGERAFYSTKLETVYYGGASLEQWQAVAKAAGNEKLGGTTVVYCYSSTVKYGNLELKLASDLVADNEGNLYIADKGNNRIVVLNKRDFKVIGVMSSYIDEYGRDQTLNAPTGLYVTNPDIMVDGTSYIFVCDTGNKRVVVFDREYNYVRTIEQPTNALLEGDDFTPNAIAIDKYGRIFITSASCTKGVIVLSNAGDFTGFIGAQQVSSNFFQQLWAKFQSSEQREQAVKNLSIPFNNITVDEDGFVYVTLNFTKPEDQSKQLAALKSKAAAYSPVKKLNSMGNEIMKRNGFFDPGGEVNILMPNLVSNIIDVAIGNEGTWTILDSSRSRTYTYDSNGNLLFAFGGMGSQIGNGTGYTAMTYQIIDGVYNIVMLDNTATGFQLTVFHPTEYCDTIMAALHNQNEYNYAKTIEYWQDVLTSNNNFDLAYIGIGKALFNQSKYDEAMEMLSAAYETSYYSKAFTEVRKDIIGKWMIPLVILAIVALVFLFKFLGWAKKKNKATSLKVGRKSYGEEMLYAFHLVFHPFDGFWDLKHEKRGSVRAATTILAITVAAFFYQAIGRGYMFNPRDNYSTVFVQVIAVLVPVLLWVVANWCLTTLFDGEGSFKDIYVATCYSLAPLPVFVIISTILTNVLTTTEGSIVNLLVTFGYVWVGILLFFGMSVTHDYSISKNIITTLGTIVAMAVIIFIAVLFSSLVMKMAGFIIGIFTEIGNRM